MNYIIKGTRTSALFSTTWGFFIGFAAVVLFAPLTNALGLSPYEKGLLLSISSLTGALFRIPFAAWVDTTGGKKPFLVLFLMAIFGMAGIYIILGNDAQWIKSHLWLLLIFGGFAGCGIATFSVGIGQTSYWFSKQSQGKALGIFAGIGNLGPGIFVYIIMNFLIQKDSNGQVILSSVRTVYLQWLIFLAIGTLIYYIINNNAWYFQYRRQGASREEAQVLAIKNGQELFPQNSVFESLKASACIWQTWVLVFIYFLSFGGFLALTNWFKEVFQNYHSLSIGVAATYASIFSIGSSIIRAISGSFLDKYKVKLLINSALALTAIGSLFFVFTTLQQMHIIGLLGMTVGMGVVNYCVFKLLPQYIPNAVGGAAGWVGGLGALGGFVFPNILSLFLTTGGIDSGYLQGFWLFFGFSVASIVLIIIMPKPKA